MSNFKKAISERHHKALLKMHHKALLKMRQKANSRDAPQARLYGDCIGSEIKTRREARLYSGFPIFNSVFSARLIFALSKEFIMKMCVPYGKKKIFSTFVLPLKQSAHISGTLAQ
jgi:hypothetical protein